MTTIIESAKTAFEKMQSSLTTTKISGDKLVVDQGKTFYGKREVKLSGDAKRLTKQ